MEPETAEQLRNDVESNLYVGNSHDDATRNAEDYSEENAVQHNGRGGVGGVNCNASGTKTDGNAQDDEVNPLRNLSIRTHQAGVDVLGVGEG